jgi:hypothetical protein
MAEQRYKCTNFGNNCSNADSGIFVNVPIGEDADCPVCHMPLTLVPSSKRRPPLAVFVGLCLVVLLGLIIWRVSATVSDVQATVHDGATIAAVADKMLGVAKSVTNSDRQDQNSDGAHNTNPATTSSSNLTTVSGKGALPNIPPGLTSEQYAVQLVDDARENDDYVVAKLVKLTHRSELGELTNEQAKVAKLQLSQELNDSLKSVEIAERTWHPFQASEVERARAYYYLGNYDAANKACIKGAHDFPDCSDWAPLSALIGNMRRS